MYISNSRILFTLFVSALFLAGMFSLPENGKAGHLAPITDSESSRLVGYWDLRDRDTFFQVTNTSGENVRVHIQVYDVSGNCAEFDYFDTLTPRDTHVYDVSSLDRNNGAALSAPDLSGGHGIIGVTLVDGSGDFENEAFLTGNFRILDGAGYEYRTNFAGNRTTSPSDEFNFNFNSVDGSVFTDVIVIGVDRESGPGRIEPVTEPYEVTLYDADENPISCPPVVVGCSPDDAGLGNVINFGINQTVTNSKGGPSLCLGTDTTGFLEFETVDDDSDIYAIFIGLNNGSGTGSIDNIFTVGEDE